MPRTHSFFAPIGTAVATRCIDGWITEQDGSADPRRGVVVTVQRTGPLRATIDRVDQRGHLTYDLAAQPEDHGVAVTVSVVTADVRRRRGVLLDLFLELEVQFEVAPEDQLHPILDDDPDLHDLEAYYDDLGAWLDGQVAASVEAPTGLDAPGVADAFRRRRVRLAVAVGLATAATVTSFVTDHIVTDHRLRVERHGIDVIGTVAHLAENDDELRVDYEVGGVDYHATHSLPDETYRIGQQVRLRVLPHDDLAIIGDEAFDDPPTDVVMAFAILGAFLLWPTFLRLAWRYARTRRRLRRGPLRIVAVLHVHSSRAGRRLLVIVPGDEPDGDVLELTRSWMDPGPRQRLDGNELVTVTNRLLVGTHSDRPRVALTSPGVVATVTRSRIALRRRWWRHTIRRRSSTGWT